MAGFGIFIHVLPEVLTELLGLCVSSFYCKRDLCHRHGCRPSSSL
jgi:hypothetical protein